MDYIKKVLFILQPSNNKKLVLLFALILIGAALETFGIAMIVPIIKLIVSGKEYFLTLNIIQNNSFFLNLLNNHSHEELMIFVIISILVFFTFKIIFISNLIWQQNKFSGQLMSQISQRLFKTYLLQPYSFHLKNNSSKLIHNITSEVNLFS